MRKLMLSMLVVASLGTGAAFAQSGDAESQAGSAWNNNPNWRPVPVTPDYSGSGWPPVQQQPYVYGNRSYAPYPNAYRGTEPDRRHLRPRRGDRDGDGIPNRRDRYPDDPRHY